MQQNDDWLYSDESDIAEPEQISSRLNKMTAISKPILFRIEQSQTRDNQIEEALFKLREFPKKVEELNKTKPWISADQKYKFIEQVESVSEWLNENTEKQQKIVKNEDPIITTRQIASKLETLILAFNRLKSTPKPTPKKVKS